MIFSDTEEQSPKLIPYPKDLYNNILRPLALEVDVCDRLWLIDQYQHKLFIIDLKQDKLVRQFKFNFTNYPQINKIEVDVNTSDCDDAYAYVLTSNLMEVIVYKLSDNKFWMTKKPILMDREKSKELSYVNFGFLDSALVDLNGNGSRVLLLDSLFSNYLMGVRTDILRNSENATTTPEYTVIGMQDLAIPRGMHFDKRNSILFFGSDGNELSCWNTKTFPNEFSGKTTETMSMLPQLNKTKVGDIVYIQSDDENNLLIVTGINGINHPSYELFSINIKELIKDTVCDSV